MSEYWIHIVKPINKYIHLGKDLKLVNDVVDYVIPQLYSDNFGFVNFDGFIPSSIAYVFRTINGKLEFREISDRENDLIDNALDCRDALKNCIFEEYCEQIFNEGVSPAILKLAEELLKKENEHRLLNEEKV